jgi:hypothetical protein
MATTASPYGLKAVNHIGGTPYAGSTRLLPRLLLDTELIYTMARLLQS